MKLRILQEDLSKALVICSRFSSSKVQLPILANVLLKTLKNKLLICATNLETSISLFVGARIDKEGEITVPTKVITEILSNLNPGQVDLESDKEILKIKAPNFESSVSGINSSDFPSVSREIGADAVVIPNEDFLDALKRTLFAVSQDETRPILTGVLVIIKEKDMILVATDGFRLSQKKLGLSKKTPEKRMILPKSTLIEVSRLLTGEEDINFSYKKNEKQVVFGVNSAVLASRVIEGEFPDFERIIPRNTKIKVTLDSEEFLQAVKLASVFARDSANVVKLKVKEDMVSIFSESSQTGTQKKDLDAKIEGLTDAEFTIAFNYRFLEEFLGAPKAEVVQLEFSDSNSPALFIDPDDASFLHIIMPVRLQG